MNLLGFALAILPVALSPGASFTLAMNNAVQQGMRGTGRIILGTLLGIYTHALLAGLGITRLIAAYPALLNTIKITGTAYLIYLGIRLIRSSLNAKDVAFTSGNRSTGIQEAYLANVLSTANPPIPIKPLTRLAKISGVFNHPAPERHHVEQHAFAEFGE